MGFLDSLLKTAADTAKSAVRDEVRNTTRQAVDGAFNKAEQGVKDAFKPQKPNTVTNATPAETANTGAPVASEEQNQGLDMANLVNMSAKIGMMTGQVDAKQAAEMQQAAELLNDPVKMNEVTNSINEIYGIPERSTTMDKNEAFQNLMNATAKIGSETDSAKGQQVNEALRAKGIDPAALSRMNTQGAQTYEHYTEGVK